MIAALFLWSMAGAAKPSVPVSDLVVVAEGFRDTAGQAILQIRGPDDPFKPGRFTWQVFAPIQDGIARFHLEGFPAGRWAMVVIHDRDRDGALDHGVLHLPSEPVGFSGDYRPGVLSGMPTFPKLAVDVAPGPARLVIHVR